MFNFVAQLLKIYFAVAWVLAEATATIAVVELLAVTPIPSTAAVKELVAAAITVVGLLAVAPIPTSVAVEELVVRAIRSVVHVLTLVAIVAIGS